jgi:hypothetical protein
MSRGAGKRSRTAGHPYHPVKEPWLPGDSQLDKYHNEGRAAHRRRPNFSKVGQLERRMKELEK